MRGSRATFAAAVLLAVAVPSATLVDLEALATAMSCCAATDYECATLGAPDDCCQGMGHIASSVVAAPPAKSFASPTFVVAVVSTLAVSSVGTFGRCLSPQGFKPPHSPPQLNSAPLRI